MMIRIRYEDGRWDMIKASHLTRLLSSKQVQLFKRAEGWVVVGEDAIRCRETTAYKGPERRRARLFK